MGTYPGVLQSYRTENCPQEPSFSPVKEIIPPDSITPGNRPKTAKYGKFGDPLGNVPGNSYLCPTLSYSVSKGFCLPPLRRVIPGGIFFVPPACRDRHPCHPSSLGCILSYQIPSRSGTSAKDPGEIWKEILPWRNSFLIYVFDTWRDSSLEDVLPTLPPLG